MINIKIVSQSSFLRLAPVPTLPLLVLIAFSSIVPAVATVVSFVISLNVLFLPTLVFAVSGSSLTEADFSGDGFYEASLILSLNDVIGVYHFF